MSDFIIEIVEPTPYQLDVESGTISDLPNITLEIVNTEKILVSDLPDTIPMSMIIGNLDVNRIDNLDSYLNNYQFDCGTP